MATKPLLKGESTTTPIQAAELGESTRGIGITEALTASEVVKSVREQGWRHIVQKSGLLFDEELATALRIRSYPRQFLYDPLSIICTSGPKAVEPRSFKCQCGADTQKATVIDQFTDFINQSSQTRRISDRAILVADELYTNSAKNSRPDLRLVTADDGYSAKSTDVGQIEMFAHADKSRLVIGCADTYGSLEISRILNRISLCLENGVVESIHRGPGGAGIGSFLVFETSVSYYVGVEKGKRTVVCVALPLGAMSRYSDEFSKHIHLINLDEIEDQQAP